MENDKLDKELDQAVNSALKAQTAARPAPTLAPLPPRQEQTTLAVQWETMEKIRWELRQKIMTGRLALENEYRTRRQEIEHAHEQALLDMTLTLEAQRDQKLKRLAAEIREKLREYEALKEKLQDS